MLSVTINMFPGEGGGPGRVLEVLCLLSPSFQINQIGKVRLLDYLIRLCSQLAVLIGNII